MWYKMPYVCQFQIGKQHFCSSTGVQMSSQNIHSIFGPNLFEGLGVYRLMQHFFHSSKVCETDTDGQNPCQTSHVGGWMVQGVVGWGGGRSLYTIYYL